MLHEPAAVQKSDPASGYKSRLGAWMFLVYALVYVGFVALNLIDPALMEAPLFAGLNVAVVYGFGLILFALVLAMVYNRMCRREEARLEAPAAQREEGGA